jgi:hypothetical protein
LYFSFVSKRLASIVLDRSRSSAISLNYFSSTGSPSFSLRLLESCLTTACTSFYISILLSASGLGLLLGCREEMRGKASIELLRFLMNEFSIILYSK